MAAQLLGVILLLVAIWLAFLTLVWIINLIVDVVTAIWNWIEEALTAFFNFFTDPFVFIPLIILGIAFFGYSIKKHINFLKEEERRKEIETLAREDRDRRETERRQQNELIRRINEEERKRKAAETRRRNAEKKAKENADRKEKERQEKAARKVREREEAIARKKAEQVEAIMAQCQKDGMPSELINFLSGVLSNVTNPSHRDVLLNIWQPLGKPVRGGLEAYQNWMLSQVSSLTNLKSIKSRLNNLKKHVVDPMDRDLSHLVNTATSSSRYDLLVALWKKYQDVNRSDEVIKRIYEGENEDYVLADLDLLQG